MIRTIGSRHLLLILIVIINHVNSSPTIEPVQSVVKVGSNPSELQQFTSMICEISNGTLDSVETRWMLPNGSYISVANNNGNKFTVENYKDNMDRNISQLFINSLSYMDNGTYSCEVRENGTASPAMNGWATANIDLVLLVHLTATSVSPVIVSHDNKVTSIELSCDMAGFIPEVTALKWYKNGELVTEDDRVSVVYRNGSLLSSVGFTKVNESVESFLIFQPPEKEDSGVYECRILNYEHLPKQTIQLMVELEPVSSKIIVKEDVKRDVMDSIIDELGSAFSASDNLDNLLPSSGSSYTPTPSIAMTTTLNTLVTTTTTVTTTIGSVHQSNTRSSTSQLVTMATMDTPIRRDSFNKNTIQLFFIFILVSIMFILLIAVGLTLLVGICLYRRKTYTIMGKPLINTTKKNNHTDNEELCMTSNPYNGKFEVVRPNAPRDIADGHTCEASTFGFPQIVITDSAHPQELISYDVPSSLLPLAPAPAQVTPRNSTRVSVLPYEITDHGSQDYDDVDGTEDMESTDYIEPFDSLNQINDASWYTFSLADNPVETPPTPPERVQSMGPKRAVSDDEHIYTEPLEPSMLSGDGTGHSPRGRGLPYAPIYDVSLPSKISNLYHAPPESVRIIQELGRGHFGNVYLAATVGISLKNLRLSDDADTSRSLLVAIKQLKSNADSNLHESFDKEVRFMSQLHHPNVARLLAVSDGGTPFIMMEYMENGDLNEFLRKQEIQPDTVPFLDENEVTPLILLYISVQIASGMKYLASRKFVHRDLATRNCLVGREFVTKISDFGMSRNIYETSYYRVGSQLILPIRWMASETFYGKFSVKSDGWSFGVTLWEIFTLCRCVPYTGLSDDQVIADALRGEERQVLPKPFDCPDEVYDVMKRCFELRITLRADFEEIYARLFVVYSKLGQMSKAEPV